MNKIYIIWIWGIGISAISRYYNEKWYTVLWSDSTDSELIWKLKDEWIDIIIWERSEIINNDIDLLIYTEAIPDNQKELLKAKKLDIKTISYPEALAEIVNSKKLITIAWTHGKSTTTSLTSLVLKDSQLWINSIVWTILKEFDNKNTHFSNSDFFIIEACEYKRSFLNYKPYIWVIMNIEADHLDYYKDLDDYILAYKQYLDNIVSWWYAIINWMDKNAYDLLWIRDDINYIEVMNDYFIYKWEITKFPNINLQIPWKHILFDAHIAYIIGYMFGIKNKDIIKPLEKYNWVWRRMENIWLTKNNNTLMSDYWHHPTEIKLTLKALKDQSPARPILTVFQPHQYNRTIELLEDFKTSFYDTDMLIIPNIYESRDNEKDKQNMNSKIFIDNIKHDNKIDWEWFKNTINLINKWDKDNQYWIILLLWAWDIDDLRNDIDII